VVRGSAAACLEPDREGWRAAEHLTMRGVGNCMGVGLDHLCRSRFPSRGASRFFLGASRALPGHEFSEGLGASLEPPQRNSQTPLGAGKRAGATSNAGASKVALRPMGVDRPALSSILLRLERQVRDVPGLVGDLPNRAGTGRQQYHCRGRRLSIRGERPSFLRLDQVTEIADFLVAQFDLAKRNGGPR